MATNVIKALRACPTTAGKCLCLDEDLQKTTWTCLGKTWIVYHFVQSIFSGLGFQDLNTAVLSGRKGVSIPTPRTPRELKLQESGTPTYGHHTFDLIADNWRQGRHRPIKVPWATLHKCGTKTFGLTKHLSQIDSD